MELNEVASSTERKMRDATQQISVLGRRLEESQRDLLMNNISFSQERENLINEIKQLNMQIAAGENELEVLRLYWARKEQEWQAVHEGLEALLAEKDQAIAELHTALAKLAAGETLSKIYARTKE
ncbi:MAG: toxic anion resistance protein [Cytophagales bacterium]|nr:toxic anion resistance protein [Bernardetiaceae bacterium]MDW8204451.1 toxic anion resistance protein [Cytophagales bacterium]